MLGFVSFTNCFAFEENGIGSEDMYIETSGNTEPIRGEAQEHAFSDYELANKEDEIILRGSLGIIQPEKFVGPKYLLQKRRTTRFQSG